MNLLRSDPRDPSPSERFEVGQLDDPGPVHPTLVPGIHELSLEMPGVQHQEEVASRGMDPVDADIGLNGFRDVVILHQGVGEELPAQGPQDVQG